ncbi:MAG TPA: hypothetical protein VG675_20290 [Bryobacteraceae bacterium]|nr:hypothetical protein [Bryobacteraceae bacterium]
MKHRLPLCLAFAWTAVAASAPAPAVTSYGIRTVAGSGLNGDGGLAVDAQIGNIQGLCLDRAGNLYLSDTDNNRVRKITPAGVISTVAGTGAAGFSGDSGPAAAAQLNLPYGLAADAAGNLYIADLGNNRVRRISPDGIITTVAGNGQKAASADGVAAVKAGLLTPRNVAVDASGTLYISEFEGHRVRKVTSDGRIFTVAGTGVAGFRGDGGPATAAQLNFPAGLALDRTGALYIADSQNQCIRKVYPGGIIATVVGGESGTAVLTPTSVAVDAAGAIYVADRSNTIRLLTPGGVWASAAGTGIPGFNGDGAAANAAELMAARDIVIDASFNLYIADGLRVREVNAQGVIHTIAGDGYLHAIGDGSPAPQALLNHPSSVALDASGHLYIADPGTERVRVVSHDGTIHTLAGTGIAGYSGDPALAAGATLNNPLGVATGPYGDVYIADAYNHRIRQVDSNELMATFAGTGHSGTGPDDTPPAQMDLRAPHGVCTDRTGTVYIVDTANNRVLRAMPGENVATAAGNGSAGDAGDGGPAALAQLNQPSACAVNTAGDLFIADTLNNRVRRVTAAGVISTVAGTGDAGFSGDENAAVSAALDAPAGLATDDTGDIFIADTDNNRIRLVTPDGVIHTIAGGSTAGFSGDGGDALSAELNAPAGVALDGSGALYLADTNNNRVRLLTPQAAPPPVKVTEPPPLSAVNAASLQADPVAPGEIVTLFGDGLGPKAGVSSTAANGRMPDQLAGVEVRFDGVAAPLFYVQASQINVQVPYDVAGNFTTQVEVRYQDASAASAKLPVVAAAPALFAYAANQDGSANSQTNPAARGTIVTFYGTGEGLTNGPNVSGQAASAPYPKPMLPVKLTIAGFSAQLLYAGEAPGLAGMLQVNARVPGGFVAPGVVPVQLTVGSAVSPTITLWIE